MMAVLKLAAVLVLGAGALLPAAAHPGHPAKAATTAPAAETAAAPVVLDCVGKPQSQPRQYVLACGDGNNYLTGMHWTQWGGGSARATGTDVANDCKPYCAAGHFHDYPVDVTLTDPVPWQGHADGTRFTKATLFYLGDRPAGVAQTITVPLPAGPAISAAA